VISGNCTHFIVLTKKQNQRTAAFQNRKTRDYVTRTVMLKQCGHMSDQHRPLALPPPSGVDPAQEHAQRASVTAEYAAFWRKVKPGGIHFVHGRPAAVTVYMGSVAWAV